MFANTNGLSHHGILIVISALPKTRQVNQSEDDNFLSGHGADVMVHTQHSDTRNLVDERFQHRASQFHQLLTCLLDQITAFLWRQSFAELSLGECQRALNANNQEIFDEVGVNLL